MSEQYQFHKRLTIIEASELQINIDYLIGAHNKKYYPIICSHCDRELLELYSKNDNDVERTYHANCPYCNNESFKRKMEGRYIVVPKPNILILDVLDEVEYTKFTLGVQK